MDSHPLMMVPPIVRPPTWTHLSRRSARTDGAYVRRYGRSWRAYDAAGVWVASASTRKAAKALL